MTESHFSGGPPPFSRPLAVSSVGEAGLRLKWPASEAECAALAELDGLVALRDLLVEAEASRRGKEGLYVKGRVTAIVTQTCVVTLEEIETDIDAPIDLTFAPPEQIPQMAALVDEAGESDEETPDPPEPIENGMIDLGRVATDAVYLALDPYPRKPGAVFEPVVEAADPEDHPFAALKALKAEPKKSGTRKPKGK